MVQEGIVVRHVVSNRDIEENRAKVEIIDRLLPPANVKGLRSFLNHIGFYHHFMKDFSKIIKSFTQLLVKDTPFVFTNDCAQTFERIKEALISALIIQPLDWNLPSEIMCNVSDFDVRAVRANAE